MVDHSRIWSWIVRCGSAVTRFETSASRTIQPRGQNVLIHWESRRLSARCHIKTQSAPTARCCGEYRGNSSSREKLLRVCRFYESNMNPSLIQPAKFCASELDICGQRSMSLRPHTSLLRLVVGEIARMILRSPGLLNGSSGNSPSRFNIGGKV